VLSDPTAVAIPVGTVNSGYLDVGGSCSGSGGAGGGGSGGSGGGGSGGSGGGSSGGGSGSGSGSGSYTGGTTIPVGDNPAQIALYPNPLKPRAYVTNENSNNVTIINTGTNMVVGVPPVPVGTSPFGIGVNVNTKFIYVANTGSGTVSVINLDLAETQPLPPEAVATISAPGMTTPKGVAVNTSANKVYVSDDDVSKVWVVNGATTSSSQASVDDLPPENCTSVNGSPSAF
jgi:YVTN family beta-propeller protein